MSSPFLGAALGLPGAVDTQWYLLVGPSDFSVIDVCFLNGVQVPTVETAQINFTRLGIQSWAYFDFGAVLFEHRGGVKAAGAKWLPANVEVISARTARWWLPYNHHPR